MHLHLYYIVFPHIEIAEITSVFSHINMYCDTDLLLVNGVTFVINSVHYTELAVDENVTGEFDHRAE